LSLCRVVAQRLVALAVVLAAPEASYPQDGWAQVVPVAVLRPPVRQEQWSVLVAEEALESARESASAARSAPSMAVALVTAVPAAEAWA